MQNGNVLEQKKKANSRFTNGGRKYWAGGREVLKNADRQGGESQRRTNGKGTITKRPKVTDRKRQIPRKTE